MRTPAQAAAAVRTFKRERKRDAPVSRVVHSMPPIGAPAHQSFSFVVEGQPQAMQRPRRNKHGAFYTPRETGDYKRQVQTAVWAAMSRYGLMRTWPLSAWCRLTARFYMQNARRVDSDNLVKSLLDGMLEIVFDDDSQVIDLAASRRIDPERPRVEVLVEVIA